VFSLRGAVAAALLAPCVAAPAAAAHQGNPNYRSDVRSIAPAVAGLHARVLNYDDRIELVYEGDSPLVVDGYRDEPYVRFLPGGDVQVNKRSPSGYLNQDRYANAKVPARANPRAAPEWRTVAQNGRYDWHDHRIHWMGGANTLPPQVKDKSEKVKVFDWSIPVEVGDHPAHVRGRLTWMGVDEGGFPIAAAGSLAAAALAGGLLVLFVRRRRGAPKEAW